MFFKDCFRSLWIVTVFHTVSLLNMAAAAQDSNSTTAKVLIYSATRGFRHDSIPTAIQALQQHGPSINVDFTSTELEEAFTDENLSGYDAVLFLSTTGEVLQAPGKAAFQRYLNLGGNFIGIHSSTNSLVNDTFFGREIGAYFDYHPPLQNATINVLDQSHPSTSMLPARWSVQDEMYNFKSDPRVVGAVVILSADESSYTDDGERKFDQGTPHPTAWYQERGAGVDSGDTAGRSFYTSLGHLNETWHDELFIGHVLGGITWVLESNTTKAHNPDAMVGAGPSTSNSTGGGAASVGSEPGSTPTTISASVTTSIWAGVSPVVLGVLSILLLL